MSQRKKTLFFLISCLFVVSCANKSEKILKLAQIDGKRICVLPGSAGDISARKNFPKSSFMVLVGSADAALAVKTGKADAFIYDKSVLLKIVDKNSDLIILDEPVSKLGVAVAVGKQNLTLLSEINSAVNKLKRKGVLQDLRKKWVDSKYEVTPTISVTHTSKQIGILKMGTCAIYEPFSFQANGTLTGIDIELGLLLGELLGKKIEIVDMAFEGLIPALQSGKIDFALSNFNITEERKKFINFSVPYIENDISVLVKR